MKIEIYIGNEQLDYTREINLQYSIGTIKKILSGRSNNSFPIQVPRTDNNRRILKFYDDVSIFTEVSDEGHIYIDGLSVMDGTVILTRVTRLNYHLVISADDWLATRKGLTLQDLDLSAHNHSYSEANILASWGANKFYRYPLINWGALSSGEGGSMADVFITDMIPMFRFKEIIEAILVDWTVNSVFMASAAFTDKYILASPPVADDEFLDQDLLFLASITLDEDNEVDLLVQPTEMDSLTLSKITVGNPVDINTETTDEGGNYNADLYTAPVTGTYRFKATLKAMMDWAGDVEERDFTFYIKRYRNPDTVTLVEFSGDTGDFGVLQTLDTGYVELMANDVIFVGANIYAEVTNNEGQAEWLILWVASAGTFFNVVNSWGAWPGINETVTINTWIPRIDQVTFLQAVKHLFNLRFFVDRNNKTVRIEPHDDFYTDNEIDWTGLIDHEAIDQDPLSKEYTKLIEFLFIEDDTDTALTAYKEENHIPKGRGTQSLYSVYAKSGTVPEVNPVFSTIETGIHVAIGWFTDTPPRIWGAFDKIHGYPQQRKTSWRPRLLEWEGLNAVTDNWKFEGLTKTTWPETVPVDYQYLINTYYFNNFHLIDKGKSLTVTLAIPAHQIQSFITAVGTETAEGFRAKYKLRVKDDYVYGYVDRIVWNGDKAKVEFTILK